MANITLNIAKTGEKVPVLDVDLESVTNWDLIEAAIADDILKKPDLEHVTNKELIESALFNNVLHPSLYNNRMRGEYILLQKLQKHPSVNNDTIKITIEYKDKISGVYKSILDNPSDDGLVPLPSDFRVTYKMPMYVGLGKLERNWQASLLFSVPEEVLMNNASYLNLEIEGGKFPTGSIPYNNHITQSWICYAPAWGVNSRAWHYYGIWYFILVLGCTLNLEKNFVVAEQEDDPHHGVYHLNQEAYSFWKNVREMRPTNAIDWPFKLVSDPIILQLSSIEDREHGYRILDKDSSSSIAREEKLSKLGFVDGDTITIVSRPKCNLGGIFLEIVSTGEVITVNDIDLESVTNRELIEATIKDGVLEHDKCVGYVMIDHIGHPIAEEATLASLGFWYGDTIDIKRVYLD